MMNRSLIFVILTLLIVLSVVLCDGWTTLKRFAYEGLGRDNWQQPERVISTLGIQLGEDIADVGAGGGYFTFRLADATGSSGTVYAADVDRGMVEYLKQRAEEEGCKNVKAILSEYHDPLLPQNGVVLSSYAMHTTI
jgi:predicted methyltransferase